jgi:hypothetical protein
MRLRGEQVTARAPRHAGPLVFQADLATWGPPETSCRVPRVGRGRDPLQRWARAGRADVVERQEPKAPEASCGVGRHSERQLMALKTSSAGVDLVHGSSLTNRGYTSSLKHSRTSDVYGVIVGKKGCGDGDLSGRVAGDG